MSKTCLLFSTENKKKLFKKVNIFALEMNMPYVLFCGTEKNNSPQAVMLSWQHLTYKPCKLGQTDLVYRVYDQSCSVGLCMQNYKSLCAAVR